MVFRITHRALYTFEGTAQESRFESRLQPRTDAGQTLREFDLTVEPEARVRRGEEPGGMAHFIEVVAPHGALELVARSLVEVRRGDVRGALNTTEDDWAFYADPATQKRHAAWLAPSELVAVIPGAARIAEVARREDGPSAASFLLALAGVLGGIHARQGSPERAAGLEEFVAGGRAGPQDYAHLMLAVCRSQRIPARYVSGYRCDGLGGQVRRGAEAMHAWLECLLPDASWVGFDPTAGGLVDDRYIGVHAGRDYSECVPTRGVYRGAAGHALEVEASIQQG